MIQPYHKLIGAGLSKSTVSSSVLLTSITKKYKSTVPNKKSRRYFDQKIIKVLSIIRKSRGNWGLKINKSTDTFIRDPRVGLKWCWAFTCFKMIALRKFTQHLGLNSTKVRAKGLVLAGIFSEKRTVCRYIFRDLD